MSSLFCTYMHMYYSQLFGELSDVHTYLPFTVYGWTLENVGQWIKQLNISLYTQYFPLFSKHRITGECKRFLLIFNFDTIRSHI